MRLASSFAVLSMLAASPALATGYVAPPPPPVVVPEPDTDWTGFYAGIGFGHLEYDEEDGLFVEESTFYSFFAGYLYDLGTVVVGGELEYMIAEDWDISVGDEDSIFAARARVGYDAGRVLPYASLGFGVYESSCCSDSDNLILIGLGADVQVTDMVRLGVFAERGINDEFDFGSGPFPLDTTTVSIRAAINF